MNAPENFTKLPLALEYYENFEISQYEQAWQYYFKVASPLEAEKIEEEYSLPPYKLYHSELKMVQDWWELSMVVTKPPQMV